MVKFLGKYEIEENDIYLLLKELQIYWDQKNGNQFAHPSGVKPMDMQHDLNWPVWPAEKKD